MRYPERRCNGGPHGERWCGAEAEYVATDAFGLQWFCCGERHGEGALLMPIEEWFEGNGMPMTTQSDLEAAERDAAELLELLEEGGLR